MESGPGYTVSASTRSKTVTEIGYPSLAKRRKDKEVMKEQQEQEKKRRIRANVKETGLDSMKYYMKTMGNHELLNKNEEIILAREIQILIKWEETREELETKLMRYVT